MQASDTQIQQNVLDELRWDTRLEAAEIGVAVHHGTVTLTGTVTSWAKKLAAAEAAHRVSGVLDVANDVAVELPGGKTHDDPALAAALRHALQWDVFVPDEKVTSTVANGFVSLGGEVETFAQRDAAARAVRNLEGVIAVDNQITVRPPEVTPEQLREAIQDALIRHAAAEADAIRIDVEGGRITVHGDVHSWLERQAIIDAVNETRGVQAVVDHLRIA